VGVGICLFQADVTIQLMTVLVRVSMSRVVGGVADEVAVLIAYDTATMCRAGGMVYICYKGICQQLQPVPQAGVCIVPPAACTWLGKASCVRFGVNNVPRNACREGTHVHMQPVLLGAFSFCN
jgi:hypothetical protein